MATIQGVYVALFGRPADPTGLAYFNSVTQNGANLNGIGDLASTQEYKDRFAGQNNTQIVNSIYQSLFGRDAESAGLNFFVDALNKGTFSIKNIAIAILDGAQGNDKTISANKVAAADLYTKAIDTPTEVGSYSGNAAAAQGRAFVTGVTTTIPTAAAVDTAVAAMVGVGAAGNTIALTAGADDLSLTKGVVNGTATVFTSNKNDVINASTAGDFNPATDKVDGGLGVDTLNATVSGLTATGAGGAGTGTIATGALTSVENVFLKATGASVVEFQNTSGVQQVWNDNSTAALSATGLAQSTTVGLKGAVADATTFAYAETAGTNTANVALDSATVTAGTAVTIADTEVFNISNTGTSVVDTLTVASAQTINVSGSGNLTLGVAATATTLDTVNASSFAGSLTFNGSAHNALKAITTGAGGDKVTIDTVHSNDITINTGAGADIITVNNSGASTKALVLTGGADADQFVFNTNGTAIGNVAAVDTNANFIKTLITISDFDKASDAIKIAVGGATPRDVILGAEQSDISTATDLLGAAQKAASYTDVSKISTFQYGADTYLFVNDANTGLNAGDTLIKVTGVNVADLTATNFQIS